MFSAVVRHRFTQFADSGSSAPGVRRWMATVEFQRLQWWELCQGTPIDGWGSACRAIVDCQTPDPIEDMPWVGLSPPVVSDRLRRLIEAYEPGCGQFLPVQLRFNGHALDLPPYWVANWLRVEDCIDWHRSTWRKDYLRDGKFEFARLVIDPGRTSSAILRVRHYEVLTLIREDLRNILQANGITGCQFYPVWHAGDDLPTMKFDPSALMCYSGLFADEADPHARIERVHEFVVSSYMPDADRFGGTLPHAMLRELLRRLGESVGVEWSDARVEQLYPPVAYESFGATGTYEVHVEMEGQRSCVIYHYCVEDRDTVTFGFWGVPAFIKLVADMGRSLAG